MRRTRSSDRVDGLDAGADDYIVKPFEFVELVARLRTQLCTARGGAEERSRLVAGRLVLDLETRQAHFGRRPCRLTQREAELLALLMQSAEQPVSRGDIFDQLWATHGGVSLNVVDVYVGYLRTKLGDITRVGGPLDRARCAGAASCSTCARSSALTGQAT